MSKSFPSRNLKRTSRCTLTCNIVTLPWNQTDCFIMDELRGKTFVVNFGKRIFQQAKFTFSVTWSVRTCGAPVSTQLDLSGGRWHKSWGQTWCSRPVQILHHGDGARLFPRQPLLLVSAPGRNVPEYWLQRRKKKKEWGVLSSLLPKERRSSKKS